MTRSKLSGALLALAGVAALVASAAPLVAAGSDAKPMIVKIHADWCGTCTKLIPTMTELEKRHGGEAVIVVLDVTDRAAVERSTAQAERLGIRDFFDAYKAQTGTVGVLAADGRTVQVFRGELDASAYAPALAQARGA